jgi:hypothetical protein
MIDNLLIGGGSGAITAFVLYCLLRRWETASLRTQLTAAQVDAKHWRRTAELMQLEKAEDKARLALFTMGGGR